MRYVNELRVRGPARALRRFRKCYGGRFSFHAFFPMPGEIQMPSAMEAWSSANWGVKRDAAEPRSVHVHPARHGAGELVVFLTWDSPAIFFCERLAQLFPDLEMRLDYRDEDGPRGWVAWWAEKQSRHSQEYPTVHPPTFEENWR